MARYHRPQAVQPIPAGVDYNLWLGPAPEHAFTQNRFHYNWHWFWDYGNGDLGNQGIHEVDVARWGLGVTQPTKISAVGGHFMFDDDQETPNTLNVAYDFDDGGKHRMMEFEVRHWMTNNEAGIGQHGNEENTIGNLFYGSEGYMAIEGYDTYKTYLGRKHEPGPSRTEAGNNWANFIQLLRTRDRTQQNAPIEEGALSVQLVHLANISYRVGRTCTSTVNSSALVGTTRQTHYSPGTTGRPSLSRRAYECAARETESLGWAIAFVLEAALIAACGRSILQEHVWRTDSSVPCRDSLDIFVLATSHKPNRNLGFRIEMHPKRLSHTQNARPSLNLPKPHA